MKNKSSYMMAGCLLVLMVACEGKEPVGDLSKAPIGWNVYMDRFKGNIGSRASEVSGDNLTEFTMTSFVSGRPNYMDKVTYTKSGDLWSTDVGTFFWPKKDNLNFYAYAPAKPGAGGTITIDKDQQVLADFTPNSAAADQKDFVYANEYSGGGMVGNSTTTTPIGLNFHHALSEITVAAKNDNEAYTIKVSGVKIGNVVSKGDFDLPYIGKREAGWTLSTEKGSFIGSSNTITLDGRVQQIGNSEATFMLIPQQLTKQTKAADGAYIALDITATSKGRTTYTGWAYVGIDTNWEMGKHYNYTIDFTEGAGQDVNGNDIDMEDKMGANSYILSGDNNITIYPYARANTFWSNSDVGDASNVIDDNTEWTAEVIWQDIASRAINFCDAKGNTLSGDNYTGIGKAPLYVKAAGTTPGNIVIGIKKKGTGSGAYLWSWHLWITENPKEIAGFMDRNLGATSATPSDGSKTYGLYYQFGRKDPFVGSVDIYDINGTKLQTGTTIANGKVTFAKTVNTPGTFYTNGNSSPYDWAEPNNYTSKNWNNITNASGKTFFDPCPPGWKLPEISAFSGFSTTNFTWDATNSGRTYQGNWFPFAGCRYYNNGSVNDQGSVGYCWSESPYSSSDGYYLSFYSSFEFPRDNDYRAYGRSVRCVQE